MSYDSAVLIHIEKQENVTKNRFLHFSKWMSENGLLNFPENLPAGDPAPTIEYLFINEETGEGKVQSATVNNIETIDSRPCKTPATRMNKGSAGNFGIANPSIFE